MGGEPQDAGGSAGRRLRVELGAVGAEGRDLAVGAAETRARPIVLAAPDDHVLQHVLPLLRHDELVHQRRAQPPREEAQADDPPLRVSDLSHLRDDRQVDERAVDGRRQDPQTRVHTDRSLADLHERVAQSVDPGVGDHVEDEGREPGDPPRSPEAEAALQAGAVDRDRIDLRHVAVAVDVAQMGHVDRILRRLLGVTGEAQGADLLPAPAGIVGRAAVQTPLRLAPADAPPGEDQAADLPRLEDPQPGRAGRRRERRMHALAGRVELEAVEGADEPALADAAPRVGAQVGTEMRADRLGDADARLGVGPDDDVLAHPRPLDEPSLAQRLAAGDEVPALGERGRRREDLGLRARGRHRSALPLL